MFDTIKRDQLAKFIDDFRTLKAFEAVIYQTTVVAPAEIELIKQELVLKEDKSNKVTSLSALSTDIQYPSAKLVYDELELKEDESNKVTTWAVTPSNTHYPSEKLVKDTINGLLLGEVNVQADWNQTDNLQDDYIKNKPVSMGLTSPQVQSLISIRF